MDERMERVKNFVKEHKVEMACAAGAVACGVLVLALTGRKPSTKKTVEYFKPEKMEVPEELVKYGVDAIDAYSGAIELSTASEYPEGYKVTVAELGAFGEALCKIPGIKPVNKAWLLINMAK